jgi:hypothetical protein
VFLPVARQPVSLRQAFQQLPAEHRRVLGFLSPCSA